MTPDEKAYLHDLSIYVGKKYVDTNESLDECELITYGKLPQHIIDLYNERYNGLLRKFPLLFKPFLDSI